MTVAVSLFRQAGLIDVRSRNGHRDEFPQIFQARLTCHIDFVWLADTRFMNTILPGTRGNLRLHMQRLHSWPRFPSALQEMRMARTSPENSQTVFQSARPEDGPPDQPAHPNESPDQARTRNRRTFVSPHITGDGAFPDAPARAQRDSTALPPAGPRVSSSDDRSQPHRNREDSMLRERAIRALSGSQIDMGRDSVRKVSPAGAATDKPVSRNSRDGQTFLRTGSGIDDSIRDTIHARLQQHPYAGARDIRVDINRAIVTVEGTVEDRQTKHDIENLIDSCPGIEDIENHIRVVRPNRQHLPHDGPVITHSPDTPAPETHPARSIVTQSR